MKLYFNWWVGWTFMVLSILGLIYLGGESFAFYGNLLAGIINFAVNDLKNHIDYK